MKRLATLLLCGMLVVGSTMTVSATSLDELIGSKQQTEQQETQETTQQSTQQSTQQQQVQNTTQQEVQNTTQQDVPSNPFVPEKKEESIKQAATNFGSELLDATNMNEGDPVADSVNTGMKKVAVIIVQVLSYFITVGLSVRLVIDAAYIALPFSRKFLSNGFQGNPQAGMQAEQAQGMGGMGMGGMQGGMPGGFGGGMGGFGGGMGGYGGRYGGGMGRYGGGMGGMNSMGAQQAMAQGNLAVKGNPFNLQLVSDEALEAVAKANTPDPQTGKTRTAFKFYFKDMAVVGVLTPVLVVLALTGALTQLGFLVGGIIVDVLHSIGSMLG